MVVRRRRCPVVRPIRISIRIRNRCSHARRRFVPQQPQAEEEEEVVVLWADWMDRPPIVQVPLLRRPGCILRTMRILGAAVT